jgi:hypothetical protein
LWLVEQAGDYATTLFHHFRDGTAERGEHLWRGTGPCSALILAAADIADVVQPVLGIPYMLPLIV